MNEFTAKKLGEVLAFARVGQETFEQGVGALKQAFGDDGYKEVIDEYLREQQKIEEIAKNLRVSDTTFNKAKKTGQKLRSMRDMYVGDEWDNPVELMEWLGFFEGAAVVHWQLVESLAQKYQNQELSDICSSGIEEHKNIFEKVSISIRNSVRE